MVDQGFYPRFVENVDLVNKIEYLKLMENLLKSQHSIENKETLFNGLLMEDYFMKKKEDTENNELKMKINNAYTQYSNTEASERQEEAAMYKNRREIKGEKPNKLIKAFDQQLSIEDEGKKGGKKRKSRKQKKSKRKSRKARKSHKRRR